MAIFEYPPCKLNKEGAMITFDIIEDAFLFANAGQPEESVAVVNRRTGETFFESKGLDSDELPGLPEDVDENPDYVFIPHKHDLDLGKPLVFQFVRRHCPEEWDRIEGMFSSRGAYRRFKAFLEDKGMLQAWYDFENARTREALLEWCAENGIEIEDKPA
ncbi:hypothetical protein Desaf_3650 [Desulfocurvibacter africanus subsp. africanus str. Walvis Bay]|uniref:Uncharacterized protein n=2 Tax=Desulfocurvibacter africanus TaxID=873 RepID=F3YYV1_DESAF|nr:hypothetical protein Desaf_3650 [Desulfocurvibacter africanus subsp. africanus str. Walvis Bay]